MATQGVRSTTSLIGAEGFGEIVDLCYDHFGTRAVACSSRQIAILEKSPSLTSDSWAIKHTWTAVEAEGDGLQALLLHRGHITKVSWAHAEFGQVVSSASSDGFVCIWTERAKGDKDSASGSGRPGDGSTTWDLASSFKAGRTPCLDMKFAPPQYGLRLGACFGDGHVKLYRSDKVLTSKDWQLVQDIQVGLGGSDEVCTKFCWRPFSHDMPEMLLLGTTKEASIWSFETALGRWNKVAALPLPDTGKGPKGVTDVSWSSSTGRASELLAFSAGQDVYIIQVKDNLDQLGVTTVAKLECGAAVHQIEWNKLGTTLATSASDGTVKLWRPDLTEEWHEMTRILGQ